MLKAVVAIAAVAFAGPALAAGQACGDRAAITERLASKYSEAHIASGLQSETKMVEIWTSPKTGSWTILITEASGRTCIAAAGQSWLDITGAEQVVGQAS